jgi:hypothetical protein
MWLSADLPLRRLLSHTTIAEVLLTMGHSNSAVTWSDAAQRAGSGAYRAQSPQTADSSPTVAYARLAGLKTVRTGSRGLLGLALCRTIT